MSKRSLSILLLAAFLLSACAPAATATLAPAATQPAALPTASPAPAQPTAALQGSGQTMQCTVESTLPTPVPANASRFASISEKDWILGDPGAKITLLEYSDFM